MRKFDVAYNPPLPDSGERRKTPDEMTMDELAKRIGMVCAKSHGDYTICEGCMGCLEGRTLIEKLKGETVDKVAGLRKLYGISPAKKQEMARELYMGALMSDDPVKYLMEKCGIDKKKAKMRMYRYREKYGYVRDKVHIEKGLSEQIVKRSEKTIGEVIADLEHEVSALEMERKRIDKRVLEINSALSVLRAVAG